MASQQGTLLQYLGTTILQNFACATTATLLHGIYVLLFSISTASIIRRGLWSHAKQAMLLLSAISFAIATIFWAAYTAALTIQVRSVLVDSPELSLQEKFRLSNQKGYQAETVIAWTAAIAPMLSDAIVIWRAWVLFKSESRWVMIGPCMLLLGTIATNLAALILTLDFDSRVAASGNGRSVPNDLSYAGLALSLGTNALATALIGYKLWTHRTFFPKSIGPKQRYTRAQNILMVLVESGVLFLAFQLVTLILGLCTPSAAPGSVGYIATLVFQTTYNEVSAMYPTIVLAVVHNQRSIVDTYGFSGTDITSARFHGHRPATVGHLSFAVPTTKHTESLETRNRTGEDSTDVELGAFEKDFDIRAEKRQARTAPF
ncbi:hypothetical protein Hypma_012688 [Hypsizygus marmoreus]|uniref:Uncharacterized protein n=1 Tax=Hypsizygus marmoreus TaxID=39966 RepID=A0A369JEE8_HYPMA|nr:hypothetical protein Hypma_012688 [Hypsizygus marmoreus]